jgi:hypothetical protein
MGDMDSFQSMKKKLNICIEMSDLSPLSDYVEIAVTQHEHGLRLSQQWYAEEILRLFHLLFRHPCSTLFNPGMKFRKESGALLSKHDGTLYRLIIGSIMYLMLATCPDLSHAVGAVSYISSSTSIDHLAGLDHILRYIRSSANMQLHRTRCSAAEVILKVSSSTSTQPHCPKIVWDTGITGYSDWAGCLDSCNITGAYIVLAGK